MSDPAEQSPRRAPAPRERITISLSAAQAEKLLVLWQEHSGSLYSLLVGWCRDAQNASDILQETFRRLAATPAIMDKMDNPPAFLAVSARRIAVDFARRSNTRSAYHSAARAEIPSAQNPGPTDEALRRAISEALATLPPDQKSVFEHKMMKGKTLDEISKLENISLNTAASRLRYAIDKIRGQLRPYYDDLNRKDFKTMKNDPSNLDQAQKRIITPLEPKRVPSVAPGLEGLAALAADDCHAEPALEIEAPAPEFVEAPAVGEVPAAPDVHAEIAGCAVGGNAWEHSGAPDSFDMPEMVTCEVLPADGEIPSEWLENPESFFATLFDGDSTGADETFSESGDPTAFDFNSGFEVCVLPVPENFDGSGSHDDLSSGLCPEDAAQFHAELTSFLLSDYQSFLHDNPEWIDHNQGGEIQAQVVTSSGYFADIEFGTPGEASAFDLWFENTYMKDTSGGSGDGHTDQDGSLNVESDVHYDGSGLISYLDGDRGLNSDGTTVPWFRSGDSGGIAYNLSGGVLNGPGLSLSGSSSFGGGTVVTGGELALGDNTHVDHADGNHLTLSNGSAVELQGGKVVSGENVYVYNPDLAHSAFDQAPSENHAATHSDAVPIEIAATLPEGGMESAYGNAAAGLAPNPGEALIVEFGVLSPSEPVQAHAHQDDTASHDFAQLDVPHVIALEAGHESASADTHHDVSASSDVPDSVLPHFVPDHETAPHEAQAVHKVDAPTAAAGAVAAGTVVQAGGVAPSMRRPLPRI